MKQKTKRIIRTLPLFTIYTDVFRTKSLIEIRKYDNLHKGRNLKKSLIISTFYKKELKQGQQTYFIKQNRIKLH